MARKPRSGRTTNPTRVAATRHTGDERTNIPTAELEGFVAVDEAEPKKLLYPRDPSLDPQLVWRGKDEQDAEPLEVPSVPIYIQETIEPKALIEDLRARSKERRDEAEPTLFADPFEGMEFAERVDFYKHSGTWTNRMILGDSLLVMSSLAEKEGLKGQVQMIYPDPPYGIKFGSNWQVSTRKRDVKDGKVEDATRQPEQIRAFRDTWELGIHSYLSYLRDRLTVARDLLTESGSIFVQIGDENVHLVRGVLDEVFGSENAAGMLSFRTKIPLRTTLVPAIYDHVLWYGRDLKSLKFRRLFRSRKTGQGSQFTYLEEPNGRRRKLTEEELADPERAGKNGRLFRLTDLVSAGRTESCVFEFSLHGRTFVPGGNKSWKTNADGMRKLMLANRVVAFGDVPGYVFFADDYPMEELDNVWTDTQGAADRSYAVQTSTKVIERCVLMTTDPGDLVVDPTCGAGTTAFVGERWARRWITVDTSRVALALARQRLTAAQYPYFLIAGPAEGPPSGFPGTESKPRSATDVRLGFVYRRFPHITLGAITNNPDIHEGMSREEIDAAIARHADTEVLYDRPEGG